MKNKFNYNEPHFVFEDNSKLIFPFGPPIYQTQISDLFVKDLLQEGRKLKIEEDDFNFELAGNLKKGRSFHYKNNFVRKVEPYIIQKLEYFLSQFDKKVNNDILEQTLKVKKLSSVNEYVRGNFSLESLWINFQKQYDHNPPHKHTGVYSFVVYLKVPDKIFEVQADSNTQDAGYIIFNYGDVISDTTRINFKVQPYEGLMLIFPNNLEHHVPPFWIDEERISVSGNINVQFVE